MSWLREFHSSRTLSIAATTCSGRPAPIHRYLQPQVCCACQRLNKKGGRLMHFKLRQLTSTESVHLRGWKNNNDGKKSKPLRLVVSLSPPSSLFRSFSILVLFPNPILVPLSKVRPPCALPCRTSTAKKYLASRTIIKVPRVLPRCWQLVASPASHGPPAEKPSRTLSFSPPKCSREACTQRHLQLDAELRPSFPQQEGLE